jgi:tRNA threonylcarbamoyladenosine biosynthesis protein TsaE
MKKLEKITVEQMPELAKKLIDKMDEIKVFTFAGPLGAGKTTLVQQMLKLKGVTGPVQSPTYTYMCVYTLEDGTIMYHFDLYRLEATDDFIEAGFDEYLYQPNSYCFIEWPEIIIPLLREKVCHVELEYNDDDTRTVIVK